MKARIPAPPRRYPGSVREDLVMQAGAAPASGERGRWRQVALLATAAALGGGARVRADLAAALHGVDAPDAAVHVAREAAGDPWARWWLALAAGQSVPAREVGAEIAHMAPGSGPDAREVTRRLADLEDELEDIASGAGGGRFGLLGVTATAPRRALIVGRSSATYLVAPSWDALQLVRLAPSDGPSGGNRAHLPFAEIIARIRRGERGTDRDVPPDAPVPVDAGRFLDGLREDRGVRDRQLLELADEVRHERAQLAADRANLRTEKSQVAAILRQVAAIRAQGAAGGTPLPETRADAAALLEIAPGSTSDEVERAFRAQVVRCHPDRVADLHPAIRGQAEALTVALNAAREILLGDGRRTRRRGSSPTAGGPR
jgi:hypothetical protein